MAAAFAAGLGLGQLALALVLPAGTVEPLPLIAPAGASPSGTNLPVPAPAVWAAAFGEERPETIEPEPAEPEEFVEDEEYHDDYPETDYSLRGVITGPDGGWAMLEGEDGVELVRVGDFLSGGEQVMSINADGVTLRGFDAEYLIVFEEIEGAAGPVSARGAEFRSPRAGILTGGRRPGADDARSLGDDPAGTGWDEEDWDDEAWDEENWNDER